MTTSKLITQLQRSFEKVTERQGTTHPRLPVVLDFQSAKLFNFLIHLVIMFANLILDLSFIIIIIVIILSPLSWKCQ